MINDGYYFAANLKCRWGKVLSTVKHYVCYRLTNVFKAYILNFSYRPVLALTFTRYYAVL